MKIFLFVLAATICEASGDAVIRLSLHNNSVVGRVLLYLSGSVLLALYGTSLNLAPVNFAAVTGLYIAALVVAFQVANYLFFHTPPTPAVMAGCSLIVAGGLVIYLWQ
jgi:drug/metabolite transporter (DMT)-like permease